MSILSLVCATWSHDWPKTPWHSIVMPAFLVLSSGCKGKRASLFLIKAAESVHYSCRNFRKERLLSGLINIVRLERLCFCSWKADVRSSQLILGYFINKTSYLNAWEVCRIKWLKWRRLVLSFVRYTQHKSMKRFRCRVQSPSNWPNELFVVPVTVHIYF